MISIRLATSYSSLLEYFTNSLVNYTRGPEFVEECLKSSLSELESINLVTQNSTSEYSVTQLGKAIVESAFDPYDGIFVHRELEKALRAFVMDGEMHVLYMFTPVQDYGGTVNWQVFRTEMQALDDSGLRVLSFLGLKPTTILKL